MKELREYTMARVGLGRAGSSLATGEVLAFQLAHAQARDAVYCELDVPGLQMACHDEGWQTLLLRSAAADRQTYLKRPDLGRRLAENTALQGSDADLCVVIADGLSALAANRHAVPLLRELLPLLPDWKLSAVCLLQQGRVAAGDEIAAAMRARMVLVLIGERPGLSSPDSLGAYLTWDPFPGRSDAERNCISNIHAAGLGYPEAARRLSALLSAARQQQLTGVMLKERLVLPAAG